jgi:hypothetical protein
MENVIVCVHAHVCVNMCTRVYENEYPYTFVLS